MVVTGAVVTAGFAVAAAVYTCFFAAAVVLAALFVAATAFVVAALFAVVAAVVVADVVAFVTALLYAEPEYAPWEALYVDILNATVCCVLVVSAAEVWTSVFTEVAVRVSATPI